MAILDTQLQIVVPFFERDTRRRVEVPREVQLGDVRGRLPTRKG